MSNSTHATLKTRPAWQQPIGAWRERGASQTLLRIGLGLPIGKEKAQPLMDSEGYTAWHYWAHSPSPHQSFEAVWEKTAGNLLDRTASSGAHAWHFLLLGGHLQGMLAWKRKRGIPLEPPAVNTTGDTFSHCLAWSGEGQALELFPKGGLLSINAADNQGFTPLVIAIHRGNLEFVHQLLMAGADPNQKDAQGRTALHHAGQYGEQELFMLLEDFGADPEERDLQGVEAASVLRARRRLPLTDTAAIREHWLRRQQTRLPF